MSGEIRVLIVEDSALDASIIELELKQAGYDLVTRRVDIAADLCAALDEAVWDVIICDYRLPEYSAPDALELVKARGLDVPFIVISGSVGEHKAVEMMRAEAQDYVIKGNLARLAPAVERELREATDRLLRAGARTRIELERLEARAPLPPRNGGKPHEPARWQR